MKFATLQKSKRNPPLPTAKRRSQRPFAKTPVSPPPILVQTKLRIGAANDRFEREADRVADKVMRQAVPGDYQRISATGGACCQMETDASIEEESFSVDNLLSMKEKAGATHAPAPAVGVAIQSLAGGGRPLDPATRTSMESRFQQDFGQVRIHDDPPAAEVAEAIGARAFTFREHIVFSAGEFRPAMREGQHLLAHELTHVLQQTGTSDLVQRTCDCTTGRRATGSEHSFLSSKFPRLVKDDYCIIGPRDSSYNCIAWSISDTSQWIWDQVDSAYGDADGTVSIADFDAFYQSTQSLTPKEAPSSNTLVALFGKGTNPTHAALTNAVGPDCGQVPFTSKLGKAWLIAHDLYQLEGGTVYGNIVRYYE